MQFTIIDATGEILNLMDCVDEETAALNTPQGGSAIAGGPSSWNAYYANGAWVEKPVAPGPWSTWDATNKVWVDPRTLAQVQAAQCSTIDAAYYGAIVQDISFTTVAGVTKMFQADADSQNVIVQTTVGYGIAGSTPAGFVWKASDNTLVSFTLADLQGLYAALLSRGNVAFQKRSTLKAQINAATTASAVEAITW